MVKGFIIYKNGKHYGQGHKRQTEKRAADNK